MLYPQCNVYTEDIIISNTCKFQKQKRTFIMDLLLHIGSANAMLIKLSFSLFVYDLNIDSKLSLRKMLIRLFLYVEKKELDSCGRFVLICRQKQSMQQIGALTLLIIAAVLLSVGEGSRKGSSDINSDKTLFFGIIPVLVASILSGLASSLCQWASQVQYLLNSLSVVMENVMAYVLQLLIECNCTGEKTCFLPDDY